MAEGRGRRWCHMTSNDRVLGGHLHFLWQLQSSFWTTQKTDCQAVWIYLNNASICIFYCYVKKMSSPAFAWACVYVCMLFLPIWSCLLESLTGEWWGHISHVPTGQPETQLSSLHPCSPSPLFLSLPTLHWSMENSLKRLKNTGKKTVLVVIVQQKHHYTISHTYTLSHSCTLISNSCQYIKA